MYLKNTLLIEWKYQICFNYLIFSFWDHLQVDEEGWFQADFASQRVDVVFKQS